LPSLGTPPEELGEPDPAAAVNGGVNPSAAPSVAVEGGVKWGDVEVEGDIARTGLAMGYPGLVEAAEAVSAKFGPSCGDHSRERSAGPTGDADALEPPPVLRLLGRQIPQGRSPPAAW